LQPDEFKKPKRKMALAKPEFHDFPAKNRSTGVEWLGNPRRPGQFAANFLSG
jgi:hypothetical protein